MREITYLTVPDDAWAHAHRFGALRDRADQWFVVGEVPRELLNFLPRPSKRSFRERELLCPLCGAVMRRAKARSGNVVWLCTARPRTGCAGLIPSEYFHANVVPLIKVGNFLSQVEALWFPERPQTIAHAPSKPRSEHPLRDRWEDIIRRAVEVLGDEKLVIRWLEQPKVALGNLPPIKVLGSPEGCAAVARLLDRLWS